MKRKWLIMLLYTVITLAANTACGLTVEQAIYAAADKLVTDQNPDGSWPDEIYYTGSIIPGLIRAYRITGDTAYKTAAEAGGDYIVASAGGNYYADEAYALTRLSEIYPNPASNSWRTQVVNFYAYIKANIGTSAYIDYFDSQNPSDTIFYMANHVVAAYYVNAADRAIWRSRLISYLPEVLDGYANYPVGALALATWALAQTGEMDSTLIDPAAAATSYWYQVTVADLPDMLASHQVPLSSTYPGSFYWRFDHTSGGSELSGYTEDCTFAARALCAADNLLYSSEIGYAQDALTFAVASDGTIHEHLWQGGETYYTYIGELLSAMPLIADLNHDDKVDIADIANFADNWLTTNAAQYDYATGADINHDGTVNFKDFAIFANWFSTDLQ